MPESGNFNKRILVAPLDWGLGHATRCIPVVRELMQLGCDVLLATAGPQEQLLRQEFPHNTFLHLPGYGVSYGKHGVMWQLLRQIPAIRRHIFTEYAWLQQAIRQHGIDGVISDNRYGLCSSRVPSVLITHQLQLQLPKWGGFTRPLVQKILYNHIEHFGECWVPDLPDPEFSMAGEMSHPPKPPNLPIHYIGWLTRFSPTDVERGNAMLIVLSGPEPQRSLFEASLLEQIHKITVPVWLVRGLPGEPEMPAVPDHVTMYNHLPAAALQQLMATCGLLISRSGYSTLMDAAVLNTPMGCIPTPGQTEQEYLAERLAKNGWAVAGKQHDLDLAKLANAIMYAGPPNFAMPNNRANLLQPIVRKWLSTLGHL